MAPPRRTHRSLDPLQERHGSPVSLQRSFDARHDVAAMTAPAETKGLAHRLVEIVNARGLDAISEVARGQIAHEAARWIGPFAGSFPDFRMASVAERDDRALRPWRLGPRHETHGSRGPARRRRRDPPRPHARTHARCRARSQPTASATRRSNDRGKDSSRSPRHCTCSDSPPSRRPSSSSPRAASPLVRRPHPQLRRRLHGQRRGGRVRARDRGPPHRTGHLCRHHPAHHVAVLAHGARRVASRGHATGELSVSDILI